jgi:hypothetical protein
VLATEHLLDLAAFDQAGELLEAVGQLGSHLFALASPVEEHAQIIRLRAQSRDQLDFLFDATAPLEDFLRFQLVVPEIRCRGAGFYLRELVLGASGFKDSSADQRSV